MPLVETLPYSPWRERGGVVDGEFRWRLGARPLDLANWIEFGSDADGPAGWIAEKATVLDAHHATAFAAIDGIEAEGSEVADALVDHLATHAPDRNRALDPTLHPLEAVSRLVPEDLLVMVERDGQLVFGGGSVCFPNRWHLPSKLGLTMSEVHSPVSRLNNQLEQGVDSFLNRLRPGRSFWRLGWGIIDVPDGYTPPDGSGPARPNDPQPVDLFVRVERETLRRFPNTNCVLFTIRTYIAPMRSVLADQESAVALAAALRAMTSDVREYKDLIALADPLAAVLLV
ncbi:MAG: hypothetical protein ACJAXA_002233 [Candidatus Aldehydirespiratoraceae bacterium]